MRNALLVTMLYLSVFDGRVLAQDTDFKIGVTLPLTGAFAEYGVAIRNGVDLAQEDHGTTSQDATFLFEDDGYEGKRGVSALEKLRAIDKVDLLFAWGIEPVRAIAPVAEKLHLPTLVGSLDPTASEGRSYVIGAFAPYREYSCQLMKIMAQRGLYRLGYIASEVSLFTGLLDAARECLQPGQSLTTINHFVPSDQDFRAAIAKMARSRFDAVGIYLTSPQLFTFLKHSSELKYKAQYFGPTLLYERSLVERFPNLLVGAFLTHNIASTSFCDRYLARFKNDTHVGYAAHAYEVARLILERFTGRGQLSSAEIIAVLLKEVSPRPSEAGSYQLATHFKGGHYFSFPAGVYQIASDLSYELINMPRP